MVSNPRIQLIHAVTGAIAPIHQAFARLWPEARPVDLADTSLAGDLSEAGELTGAFTKRMAALIGYGIEAGADAILFTCSAFGAAIEQARQGVAIPVLKPDEAMIARALSLGPRIGGLATFAPTIPSLASELEIAAEVVSLNPEIELRHVAGALDCLNNGDRAEHDRLVVEAAAGMTDVDALLLAQFTMSGVRGAIPDIPGRTVLSSPDEAVLKLRDMLDAG
ncbi:MAG: arylsulfatase [Rhodospirillales bacterium]|nr:arylsulfatase [Rhodospirillales bacterium]